MKRLLCLLLSAAMFSCVLSGCSRTDDQQSGIVSDKDVIPNEISDFVYSETEDGIKITGYKGSSTEVNIPSEINGKPVYSIGEYAFDGYEEPDEDSSDGKAYKTNNINSIISVHIPSSVKTLEKGAFTNCYSLQELTFSEGAEKISEGAFACCDSLLSVSLPNSVKTIESYAFFECYSIESVSFGKNVETIGDYAFYSCNVLRSAELPESVKELGTGTFAACERLTEITLSKSLTEIPENCFTGSGLNSITIPEGIKTIAPYAFCRCSELSEIKIPSSVASVGEKAFFVCNALTETEVPDSVSDIGEHAFGFTADLTQVTDENELKEYLAEDFTLKGSSGSAAEKYAKDNGINFKTK